MKKELAITAQPENISEGVEFIEAALTETGVDRGNVNRSTVAAEELLTLMVQHSPSEKTNIHIRIKVKRKYASVSLSARGSEFSLSNAESTRMRAAFEAVDEEQETAIRSMLLNALSDSIQLRHVRGINRAEIKIGEKGGQRPSFTLICMFLGLLLGAVMRPMPSAVSSFISTNILAVISKLFLNAINMLIVPMVFFSVASSVTGFSDLKAFGRIGGKVIRLYLFTSVVAFFIAVMVMGVFHPGDPSLRDAVIQMAETSTIEPTETMTLPNVIMGIVPSNLVGAFLNADMLQIIFLSLITGIASGRLGKYTEGVQYFLNAGNALFSQITKMFVFLTPAAVACIMANMAFKIDVGSLKALLKLFMCTALGIGVLFGFYCILIAVMARKSPKQFLKKFRHAILTAMSTTSSSASLPAVLKCVRDMGIAPKLYYFSIPLGNIINMDGMSIFFTVSIMFMMRVFGVQMSAGLFISMFLNVLLIAAATPGIPNASIVMLAVLFSQFGVPAGAVAFMLGFDTLIRVIRSPSNITGDAVVTLIVAANEGMLDEEMFNS